jgi:hypothetical protein
MLIREIIDPNNKKDLFDYIGSNRAAEIDKFCDEIEFIIEHGNRPLECFSAKRAIRT